MNLPEGAPPPPADGYYASYIDPFALRLPEALQLGPLEGIRWYGLAYIAGFAIAWLLLWFYNRQRRIDLPAEQRWSLLTAIVIGTFIGGRLGYLLLYRFEALVHNPFVFFQVQDGGMASHGGMIGICLGVLWFCWRHKRSFWNVADWVVTLAPPGVFFGRLANFVNGELYGKVTDVPWAMHFLDWSRAMGGYYWTSPVHPYQLYAALLEGLVLCAYLQLRFWSRGAHTRPRGQLAAEALIAYAVLRIIGEIFREPDAGLLFGLSRGTFYSIVMLLIGLSLFVWRRKHPASSGS